MRAIWMANARSGRVNKLAESIFAVFTVRRVSARGRGGRRRGENIPNAIGGVGAVGKSGEK